MENANVRYLESCQSFELTFYSFNGNNIVHILKLSNILTRLRKCNNIAFQNYNYYYYIS